MGSDDLVRSIIDSSNEIHKNSRTGSASYMVTSMSMSQTLERILKEETIKEKLKEILIKKK